MDLVHPLRDIRLEEHVPQSDAGLEGPKLAAMDLCVRKDAFVGNRVKFLGGTQLKEEKQQLQCIFIVFNGKRVQVEQKRVARNPNQIVRIQRTSKRHVLQMALVEHKHYF
jgi:hypothetical protein